jgi:hypothetical protein
MPAVVLPYWKMPPARLVQFCQWNEGVFREGNWEVFVVTEPGHAGVPTLPYPCTMLAYPRDHKIFSLTRTCNYGIKTAMKRGHALVMKTDADIVFPQETMREIESVKDGQAYSPPYHMVDSFEDRHAFTDTRLVADLAIGTVVMTAEGWNKTCGYNEHMMGYGCDDGDMWHRIGLAGIKRYRGLGVYHIAHLKGSVQQEQHVEGDKSRGVRTDHHGREAGINPNKLRENTKIAKRAVWNWPQWGEGLL